uniref:HEAT repeat-containing protein 1 n=1 Tax=Gadus morhua TaxID=8049 RepID=A0A8C5BFW7_GADMO
MTSLAHQLKRLALPQNDPNLFTRKEVASLLFDPKYAATMDRTTFYALGCNGLEELLGIEPAFAEFQDTLFNQGSVMLERSVQSKEINEKLDKGISLFLARISPYFLLKPAQKCLEWLIHRFHIQLYNVDSLLACTLPYHETKIFSRVVQLLKISEPTHRWHWLHALQVCRSGVPLARGTLITHCYKDLSFMDFICTMVTKAVEVSTEVSSHLRVVFAFYASTMVSTLDAVDKVTDTIISKLLPFVQKGLKSSVTDYKAATYMIVCQLAVKVVMEGSLVNTLALHVAKSMVKEPVLTKEGLGCLIVLIQNQKKDSVGPKAFGHLCCVSSVVESLQAMALVHDISPLLHYLLPLLVHAVVTERYGTEPPYVGALDMAAGHGGMFILGDSDTSLLLSLKHPLSSVRNLAVEHLAGLLSSGQENLDQSFLREALLDRMQDHVPEVVAAALKALEVSLLAQTWRSYHAANDTLLIIHLSGLCLPGIGSLSLSTHLIDGVSLCRHLIGRVSLCLSLGDVWWNPEKLDTSTCCYLHLLCRLFDVTISGSSQGPAERPYRDLMKLLFQVHLSTPMDLMKFLCMLWDYGANQGDQLDVRVGAVLQTQALYVGQAVLTALPASTLPALASNRSPVVPSLLACLCSPLREVRRAAVAVLDQLSEATESSFQPLITRLLKNTEEIIADPSHLSQALSVLHEEVSADAEPADPQKPTLGTAFQQLLQTIKTSACPSYTAVALLRALDHVNGESVLMALMPVLDLLVVQSGQDPTFLRNEAQLSQLVLGKYNEEAAPLLAKDQACLALFVQALKSPLQPYPDIPSIQVMALEQITKAFFAALGEEKVQQQLLGVMFDLLADSREALVSSAISSVFKGLAVDAELVAKELVPPEKPKVSVTVQQTRRSKMLQSGESKPEEEAVLWQRVTLILELLQHKKKLKRPQALVPALFTLLSRSLQPGPGIQANVEYTRQLLLSCLLNVCQKLSPDGEPVATDILEEDKFNVELVVQCVRVSDMPQTHHHALLLLGTVASMFPEKVLHNIMPIFTFMGANIMRLDDSYSFQVINKTVQTVIPALIKVSGSETSNMDVVVIKIVHVFVDALPHVPEHRRLPILSQLVTTLGPARFLWVLMLLLFKQHATKTAGSAADKVALEMDVEFWTSLCCTFEVSEQLTSVIHILQYLMGLPQDKEDGEIHSCYHAEELLFNVEAHSSKELRHFKFLSVNFTAQLLAASGFIGKVGPPTPQGETLRYIHSVARCVEENSDKPTAKFWRALLNKAYDVLDKVNSLLPTDTFIMVMKGLMTNRLPSVRRKAMELLNNKLQHKTKWEEQQVHSHPEAEMREEQEEELAINRQTALYSLKLLCRNFGAAHPEAFVPVLQRAVEVATATEEEKNVTGSALLCIAEVASVLKTLAIPQLPRLMPAVLQTMEERKDLLSNEIYLLSAVTALQRVSETLPHFISPYLHATVSQVSKTSATSPQLSARLTSLSSTLATKVPPRVLLPTLTKCYNDMSHLGPLMSILKAHITHMEKDQLNTHQSELTSFFLTALDFRAQHCQGDLPKTAEVEGFTIDCLLAMVMKLSEITFRPLFFKLFDWSKTETEGKQRLLTFYRLADRIADRLKGLFVLFAGNLVKPFSDLLQQTNVAKTDEALFDSADGVEKSTMLLHHVLDCMFKIFMYDTHHFLSKDRAEALMGPLVDQLENTLGGEESYQLRVTQHLVPCLGQFSVAMGDDTQWKTLNYQVLLKTRHSSSKVRFSALLMVMELARKLRENYMVLLPETIPFLAELMEDESEEVEHQVQKVIQEMENILGEPLQSYF